MKLTSAICALIFAASVTASALPAAAAEARCGHPGQPCGKAKRVALPEPEARCGHPGQPCGKAKREAAPRCGHPGQPCGKVKRAAEAFAEALAEPEVSSISLPPVTSSCSNTHDAIQAEASADWTTLDARCNLVGGACYEAKRLTRDLAAIVASTQDDADDYYDSLDIEDEDTSEKVRRDAEARCGHPGQPCGKAKREPEARCGHPGQPCGKAKREAEARCGHPGQPCGKAKREADPEAEARCGHPGQPCGKLRRAAEAIAEAVAEAEPEARCGHPGQPCGKAKRDAHALAHASDVALSQL
ncbi:hypothetical protein QTJ16_002951 [Diplocarpon rosae]|uniref:Uncharacterized protein n=1 Tax=Diplocarpon rosae TaxID=946125 RepID=A0AAD9WEE8_9HELO|nr:hypothetical protein QTJ16_002951 [Diplocarpon rosae]